MKTLKKILFVAVAATVLSCGNTQPATTSTVENTPDTKGTIREVADRDDNTWNRNDNQNSTDMNSANTSNTTNTTTDRNRNNVNNSSTDTGYNNNSMNQRNNMDQKTVATNEPRRLNDAEIDVYWVTLKKKDMSSMYDYLNMSEDQILKYQRGYTDYISSMQAKDMRMTIDQRDLLKQRDGILYDILKPAQYDKYQQWKMKNPNGGL